MRLQKLIADAGIASRRHAEELIREGRVAVNGAVVREMGVQVDATRDQVRVSGKLVQADGLHTYLLLNKPRGVLTTVSDPEGRRTIMHLIPREKRLYPVGRLDVNSEGLVLLTDDGALANRLMHPRYEHEKEYRVLVEGRVSNEAVEKLRAGVKLADGVTAPTPVDYLEHVSGNTWLRIVLREGRKRQIRRMLEQVGYRVKRLVRVRMGPLLLGELPLGQWRALSPREVKELKRTT